MGNAKEERRGENRRPTEMLVRFDGDDFSIYSRATNISRAGAFVATHYLLDPGTEIQIHLFDPSGTEAKTNARVVRTMSLRTERGEATIGMGVEFLDDQDAVSMA